MSMDVSCKVCGRKIVNLATSHLCGDGSYVGPVCKGKLGEGEVQVPSLESLILTAEEAKAIDNKILKATYDVPGKDMREAGNKLFKEVRNLPWDPYSGAILKSPAHPNAIASVNLHELMKFKKLLRNGEDAPALGYEDINEDSIARAVHCFLKLFKDPNLNKEQLELFNKKLGIRLLGVAPCEKVDESHSDFSTFVITSSKSPCPERAIMIKVSSAGWINFRCLNLIGNNVEVSDPSSLEMIVPMASRRTDSCPNFKLISAFVVSIFMMDNPEDSDAFKKAYPFWKEFNRITGSRGFGFHIPDHDDDGDTE